MLQNSRHSYKISSHYLCKSLQIVCSVSYKIHHLKLMKLIKFMIIKEIPNVK